MVRIGSRLRIMSIYPATQIVACPSDRRCQVGMGVFAFGEPRGEKIRFSGEQEITVIVCGSLHFRVDDGKGPCKIGFAQTANCSDRLELGILAYGSPAECLPRRR